MPKTQEELRASHGTPAEFATAVIAAIGEISPDEALKAILCYLREWEDAGLFPDRLSALRELQRESEDMGLYD